MKFTLILFLSLWSILPLLMTDHPKSVPAVFQETPIIKNLGSYKGNHFPSFAEFRVQNVRFSTEQHKDYMPVGTMVLLEEPYDLLINITNVSKVHRFEDAKKTDHSCLMYFKDSSSPILVRMSYKDIFTSIRKASEAMVH